MTATLYSRDSEQAVLGAVLLGGNATFETLGRLRSEHFYVDSHRLLWGSMVRIYDVGGAIDHLTVAEDMKRHDELADAGGQAYLDLLSIATPNVSNVDGYARRVKVLADLRRLRAAGHELIAGAEAEDNDRIDEAVAMLMEEGVEDTENSSNPEQLAELVFAHLDAGGGEAFPFPFDEATEWTNGGARRGEVTIVAGHSSHGKTVIVDQFGSHFAERNLVVHAWINEMTRLQRACRLVAAPSGVSFGRIMRGKLSGVEMERVSDALGRLPFGITEAPEWTAEEIARDIRRRRPDVAIVDIMHRIPHSEERDLSRISRVLNAAAKQANCHLVITAHLNEGRKNMDGTKPAPTVGDIKGSGSIKNDADNVFFIYRSQEERSGLVKDDGWFYAGKVRNGAVGKMRVVLDTSEMRFDSMGGYLDEDVEDFG